MSKLVREQFRLIQREQMMIWGTCQSWKISSRQTDKVDKSQLLMIRQGYPFEYLWLLRRHHRLSPLTKIILTKPFPKIIIIILLFHNFISLICLYSLLSERRQNLGNISEILPIVFWLLWKFKNLLFLYISCFLPKNAKKTSKLANNKFTEKFDTF